MSSPTLPKKIKVIDTNKITIEDEKTKKNPRVSKIITLEEYNKNNSFRRTNKVSTTVAIQKNFATLQY